MPTNSGHDHVPPRGRAVPGQHHRVARTALERHRRRNDVRPVGVAVSPVDGALYISSDRRATSTASACSDDARRRAAIALAVGCLAGGAAGPAAGQTVAPQGTQPGGLASGTAPADVASKCNSCHAGGSDDDSKAFRPWDTWGGTMMANAVRDPLFLAALTVSEQDAPGSGAYCLRCHTPKGFVRGHATRVGAALDADDQQGVDCEACHRSIDASTVQPPVMYDGATIAALAALDLQAPYIGSAPSDWDPRDVRHGPYDDADSPAHAAGQAPFTSSSELCGQCHEVLSPLRNLLGAAGTDTGFPFPLDNTYTEWLSSDYARGATARSCIDCHMPAARGDALKVSTFPSAMSRANPRTHVFVGGNAWGLEAVKLAAPEIATERSGAFEVAAAAVQAMLESAVRIDVMPGEAHEGGTTVDLVVRVTNLSGHKFPTGYADGRRAFLQVELQDAQGGSLAVLGKYDAASAHIDAASELRVWESIQAEHLSGGGHLEWHIAKNDTVVKDTRIPPAGFQSDRRRGDRDDRARRRRLRSRHRHAELRRRVGAVHGAGGAAARIAEGRRPRLLSVHDARVRRGAGARQHDR